MVFRQLFWIIINKQLSLLPLQVLFFFLLLHIFYFSLNIFFLKFLEGHQGVVVSIAGKREDHEWEDDASFRVIFWIFFDFLVIFFDYFSRSLYF